MKATFFDALGNCKKPACKAVREKRGGSRPHFAFQFSDQWTFTRTTIPTLTKAPDCAGIAFDADFVALAKQARRPLKRIEADFVWLALAIYLADRFAPRHPYGMNATTFWRRRIHLSIPVSDPAVWNGAAKELIQTLEFLTEDDWSFEFVVGRTAFAAERQEHFRQLHDPDVDWACLFSGGLDSLAGALRWLQDTSGTALLVSGQTHNRIATEQQAQVAELDAHFPQRLEHLGVSYSVPDKRGITGFESSQRTRAFIHTALGSLAALMGGVQQLCLFENGFGALNLSCDTAQLGSQNSRGTHPVFLRRMASFVSRAFSQPFIIANPFTFLTKSQMLTALDVGRFAGLFEKSFSCDRYPNYLHRASQCGFCASCLIRRLAFHSAGLQDGAESYSTDIFHPRRSLRESEWLALTKLSVQADALAASLSSKDAWASLCASWPDLLRAEIELATLGFRDATVALLRRHTLEWQSFSNAVNPVALDLAA